MSSSGLGGKEEKCTKKVQKKQRKQKRSEMMTAEHLQKAAQRGRDWAGQSTSFNMGLLQTLYILRLRLRQTTLTGSPLSSRYRALFIR
jgi:hypothetical protein